MNIRRVLAACALAMVLGFHGEYLALPLTFFRWESLHRALTASPNGRWPEYPLFLDGVRTHTQRGDRIAVIVPAINQDAYLYAYCRASYFLAGREVLPLYYPNARPENLANAKYLGVWRSPVPPARVVWQGYGGFLLSRR
jgi:hypothetical protein